MGIETRIDLSEFSKAEVQKFLEDSHQETDMADWWFGTVFFAIFPILLALVIGYSRNGSFDFLRIIGDGELILCSFSVSTPSLISQYVNRGSRGSKGHYYASLIIVFFQLVSYTSIKTNPTNIESVVFITSGMSFVSSVLVGFLGERRLKGGRR